MQVTRISKAEQASGAQSEARLKKAVLRRTVQSHWKSVWTFSSQLHLAFFLLSLSCIVKVALSFFTRVSIKNCLSSLPISFPWVLEEESCQRWRGAAGAPGRRPVTGAEGFSLAQCSTDSKPPRKQNKSRVWISGKLEYLERALSGCGSEALNH